jgi:hypothetical protein
VLIGIALKAESRDAADGHLALAAAEGDRFTKFAVELCRSIADLALEGGREIARERLGRAFATWERETVLREPSTPLEKDLAAIRRQVFRPKDERFFHRAWKPDSWPGHKVVSPETEVVFPDGTKKTVTLYHSYPEVEGVVQFTAAELGMIQTILDGFGGDERTRPGWIMAIPQPEGMAKTIREFTNDFIKLVPGHWGGWHICTYPTLNGIVFRDAGRTGATAKYRVKYRGGEAAMVKSDGQWRIKETQFTWME